MGEYNSQTAETNQSLLGAIRQTERTMKRRLAAAHEAAASEIERAEEQARQIISQAAEDGRLKGESARQQAMKEIELEAAGIVAEAEKEAQTIGSLDRRALDTAVNQVVEIITNYTG